MDRYRTAARALFCVTFLFWFSQYAYTPYLNPELQAMGASATFIGLVGGGYGFTQLLSRLPLGIAADRFRCHKTFILAGCLLSSLSGFGMYFRYTPAGFLVFRALGGFAAATWVAFTVLYSSYFPAEKGPQAINMLNVANQAGRLLCFVLVAALVGRLGERSSFFLAGLAGLAAAVLCLFVRNSAPAGAPVRLQEVPGLLRDRNLLACTLLAVLTQVVAFSTYSGFVTNYAVDIGAQAAQLSLMSIVMMVPLVASNYLVASKWLNRFGARSLLEVGFGLTAIYCVVLPWAPAMEWVYVLQALAGVSNTLTMSVLLGVCVQNVDPGRRSTAMGFFQAIYGLGMTAGPILMGMLTDGLSLSAAFRVMSVVSLLALVLTLTLLPRRVKRT